MVATKVDGRGTINSQSDRVTFHLGASQSDDSTSADYFSFCDPAAGGCLTNAGIRNLSINGQHRRIQWQGAVGRRDQNPVQGECD